MKNTQRVKELNKFCNLLKTNLRHVPKKRLVKDRQIIPMKNKIYIKPGN